MSIIISIVVAANAALFCFLAGWGVALSRREASRELRTLALGLAVVSTAFVVSAVTRMMTLAVSEEWVSGSVERFLVSEWVLAQAVAVTLLGVGGLFVVSRVAGGLQHNEKIITALSDRLPHRTPIGELGFTARELEVIDVIASGSLSDRDVAEALFISPSTAGTHIKNIMRKAGVSSRRDLVLLAVAKD